MKKWMRKKGLDLEIVFNHITFKTEGTRIGQTIEMCYSPRSGVIVGHNEARQLWLVKHNWGWEITEYSILPESHFDETNKKK